jgi:mannosyltransferase
MKIIYDNIIFSLQNIGGISVYWFELLDRMLRDNLDLEILESKNAQKNILRNKLEIDQKKIINTGHNLLSRTIPLDISSNKEFVLHSSYYRYTKNSKSKVITTVHDFIQENTNPSMVNLNSIMKRKAINNSDMIIAISESTKIDILKYFPTIDEKKIKVIYNGVSEDFFPLHNELNSNFDNVLFVGSRADYKNFSFVVNLVAKYEFLKLFIVGKELSKCEIRLLNSNLSPLRWRLFTGISNMELNILYNQSLCLLYPSIYEGFGIPVIEAMKAGCPVIALNKSSIPEVSGNAAILFDSASISDFYDAINVIIDNREIYKNKGIENAKRFSWEKTYNQTINIYN